MRRLYEQAKGLTVYDSTLDRNKSDRIRRAEQLTELLGRYDEIRDLTERKETIERLLESRGQMHFQFELRAGQLAAVNEQLKVCGSVSTEDKGYFDRVLFKRKDVELKNMRIPTAVQPEQLWGFSYG